MNRKRDVEAWPAEEDPALLSSPRLWYQEADCNYQPVEIRSEMLRPGSSANCL